MRGLVFENSPRPAASAPERTDVACFVGLARRRAGAAVLPQWRQWLTEQGWTTPPNQRVDVNQDEDALTDVPLPVERWETYAHHFEPEGWLGAAVRSFFSQGGRRCYVVRVDNPASATLTRTQRLALLAKLLDGQGALFTASPAERGTWHGAAHLFGLPEVSFLSLPDVPALVAAEAASLPAPVTPPTPGLEQFVECSEPPPPLVETALSLEAAPRSDFNSYKDWSNFLERVKELLRLHLREVQWVAAVPLPHPEARAGVAPWAAEDEPLAFLLASGALPKVQSAFVQLVYPWVRTPGSASLPEGLENPEGVLVGLLARNALTRGTFRSALGQGLGDVLEVYPVLERRQLESPPPASLQAPALSLEERVSVLAPTASGLKLVSDVTTHPGAWRQASVQRLFSALVRATRRAGLEALFEPSGPRTWQTLKWRLESVLTRLWDAGALRGATPSEAYSVRCDRTTMTQADMDSGRLVAEVEFDAAAVLERIQVVLTVAEGGAVALRAREAA